MTEAELQDAIAAMARALGWMVAHFRPARTDAGWRTAGQYDAKGFPDLVLAHKVYGVLFVEVKSATGKQSVSQLAWQHCIDGYARTRDAPSPEPGRARFAVWRPIHWASGSIEHVLRGFA